MLSMDQGHRGEWKDIKGKGLAKRIRKRAKERAGRKFGRGKYRNILKAEIIQCEWEVETGPKQQQTIDPLPCLVM